MGVAGLFSGIGGFELAFAEAGFHPELLVEIDSEASAVLRRRFPGSDIFDDVLKLRGLPSGISILVAGFPCQNLSMAGDKAGLVGRKSRVVKKIFEFIPKSRVDTIVIENVYFMLQLRRGMAMRWLVEQLERMRYSWAYRVLDTMGFGLPQRRRRVYLVASRVIDPRSVLFADRGVPAMKSRPSLRLPLGFYWTEGRYGVGFTIDGIPRRFSP